MPESDTNQQNQLKQGPAYICYTKLISHAKELAHALNKALSLEEYGVTYEHTMEFANLMDKCGQELVDIGEYMMDTCVKLKNANSHHARNEDTAQVGNSDVEKVTSGASSLTRTDTEVNNSDIEPPTNMLQVTPGASSLAMDSSSENATTPDLSFVSQNF